ncbi:aminodeoxychorismate synthase component I [Allonocardiopsis opalescens]|uniref:aminodeoxychorismate synthase n=1 Tax=Allonocardiopsis opalescens TaxID=1144618 RepID=A0A2T0QDM3_9ACTN|nr:aminodeoxychorismate synthase component I [Allonocardiopsis opalescens]PRY02015.1 aminodeoxychorismate synthase subunit I /aminodeoxychorismate synthase glutamine amidotransferase subunit [Allonocardiopsis opalescens]
MRTLLIDNYDSYTYNLAQLIGEVYGEPPLVVRNDEIPDPLPADLAALVVSPGPGHPATARDVGALPALLARTELPVLGVCLGHQLLGLLAGAAVRPAPEPRHGHVGRVAHTGEGLFAGVPQHFAAVRYHSLCVAEPLPPELAATAWAEDGVLMGLAHTVLPWWGVQFHPESVGSAHGARLLRNFRELALRHAPARRPAAPRRTGTGAPRRPVRTARGGWRLAHRRLDREVPAPEAFQALFGADEYAFWLDSGAPGAGSGRYSLLGAPQGPHGEVLRYRVGAGKVECLGPGGTRYLRGSVFDALGGRIAERAVSLPDGVPPELACGYVGYFGYELKAECGGAAARTAPLPDAVWAAAGRLLLVDHRQGATWLAALTDGTPASAADAERWLDRASAVLDGIGMGGRALPVAAGAPDPDTVVPRRRRTGYLADVAECRRLLRAGESYEICLTTAADAPFTGDPFAFYLRQRAANPAPYAAYLALGPTRVLCSSPERFCAVDAEGWVESRPIKGTAPRHPDPAADGRLAAGLAADPKSRAENLMIVDLLRNDLGRVCETGAVEVPELMAVESYATVHQLVSTVRGRLRPGVDAVAAVRACFPGGSMTGAPKLRTMEILDRIEGHARGIYSGALGYFGLTGTADLNIVIRTAVVHDGRVSVGGGGAIVLDSDPAAEYDEMLLKIRAALAGGRRGSAAGPAVTG